VEVAIGFAAPVIDCGGSKSAVTAAVGFLLHVDVSCSDTNMSVV